MTREEMDEMLEQLGEMFREYAMGLDDSEHWRHHLSSERTDAEMVFDSFLKWLGENDG